MPDGRPRALVNGNDAHAWVRDDIAILQREFDVEHVHYRSRADLPALARAVKRADVTLSWFVDVPAAVCVWLSRRFHKPALACVGGYDAASLPGLEYGLYHHADPIRRRLADYVYRRADRVLVVDPSLTEQVKELRGIEGPQFEYLPFGYDADYWSPGDVPKERRIMMAAVVGEASTVARKGIPTFVEAARRMPDVPFDLVGTDPDGLAARALAEASPNLQVVPKLPRDALRDHYRRAKVYAQLSAHEGLPNTLCEALFCGAIPVGTPANGIPTAIGNSGWIVPYGDVDATVDALGKALDADPARGEAARAQAVEKFAFEKRAKRLLAIVHDALQ